MSKYPFIQSLQAKNDKTELPRGHKYSKFEVVVEGEKVTVHIPKSESETFLTEIEALEEVDKYHFNKIMREVRGIRG